MRSLNGGFRGESNVRNQRGAPPGKQVAIFSAGIATWYCTRLLTSFSSAVGPKSLRSLGVSSKLKGSVPLGCLED